MLDNYLDVDDLWSDFEGAGDISIGEEHAEIGFLGDRAFGGTESDRFYKIGKRSSGMDPASGNL